MKSQEISLDFCSALMSRGFAVSEVLWLGNFAFLPEVLWLGTFACLLGRLDGKDADSSSRAHRIAVLDDNVHWALMVVALEDNVHWALVALDDRELASKKKRAGKTPGGIVHRFHHMLSVEQRWLEIWSSLVVSGFAHKLAFSSTNNSQPVSGFDQICRLQDRLLIREAPF